MCTAFAPVLECFLVCPGELADDQVIHFTGYDVKNILTYHGIPLDQHVFYSGTLPEYKMLFRKSSGNCSSASMAMRTILPRCSTRSCFLSAASSRKVKMWRSTFRKKSKPPLPTLTRTITPKSAWRTMQNRCTSAQTGSSETSQAVYENKPCAVHPVASMVNAQSLLENTDYKIGEIAEIVGYDNQLYFSRVFRKEYGVSPAQYRKKMEKSSLSK